MSWKNTRKLPSLPATKCSAYVLTLHGGVGLTMTYIRLDYWIPCLRRLTKKVIRGCFGCKRFQATAFQNPPPGDLQVERTTGSVPFQFVGVAYAGPISYKTSSKRETGKAYILLFACSLTRPIHLELLSEQTTGEYIKSLREGHNLNHNKGGPPIEQGDVVLIQSDEHNRSNWNIGVVVKLIKGRDGIVRGARLRAGKSFLERAVQQLCPMELSCDRFKEPEVPVPRVTTSRTAAIVAAKNIKDIAEREKELR